MFYYGRTWRTVWPHLGFTKDPCSIVWPIVAPVDHVNSYRILNLKEWRKMNIDRGTDCGLSHYVYGCTSSAARTRDEYEQLTHRWTVFTCSFRKKIQAISIHTETTVQASCPGSCSGGSSASDATTHGHPARYCLIVPVGSLPSADDTLQTAVQSVVYNTGSMVFAAGILFFVMLE
jgi:hypothetical protein